MTDRTVTAIPAATQVLPARLEPDAIGAAQDTIIGMGNSAPTVALGLSLAGLAAASAYGSGPVILLCGIPMLIIANAYRRLNLWSANCGASFEWVGRAINPYLGFMTGWLMIAGQPHRGRLRRGGSRPVGPGHRSASTPRARGRTSSSARPSSWSCW